MDYAMLPPEVNSGRLYAGPGSAPMLVAAEAWEKLTAELYSAANSYQAVVSALSAGPWLGPSSASMAAAAASHVTWLNSTAAQAEETATQAKAAVAAYQEAYAAIVPPPTIALNRSVLARLLATNVFGQNTSAIASVESQYVEMWAQDAAVMYGYAGSSAAATTLTPFTEPQQNTDSAGPAAQAAAVNQSAGTSAGNTQSVVSSVQQALTQVPSALQSLAAPAQATDPLNTLSNLISIFLDLPADVVTIGTAVPLGTVSLVALPFDIGSFGTGVHTDDIVSGWNGEESFPGTGPAPVKEFPAPLTGLRPTAASVPTLSAGLGEAKTVGAMSVPPTWSLATPAVRPVAYTLPVLPPESAVPTVTAGVSEASSTLGSSSTLSEMALAGMAGRAMAGTLATGTGKTGGTAPRRDRTPAGEGSRKPADGATTNEEDTATQSTPRAVVTGVAAELREFAKLRDEGILTDEEYTEQKNRLLGR